MSVAIVNIGRSHRGDLAGTPLAGDALVCDGGVVAWIGASADVVAGDHEQVLDAGGAGVIPGLIDSHVHITFGDYTPRQQTVGYLESYLHGGTTRAITASEVHVPGRPKDPAGVKALAIAAQRCFAGFRPGGVTVHAGSVILEPGLTREDFEELKAQGVWLAKAGFGAFETPLDYVPVAQAARAAGLLVTCHTGGGSIPGSLDRIDAGAVIAMGAHVSFHVNGGPTAMSVADNEKIVAEGGDIALQLAMAGNLRSALHICRLAREQGRLDRMLISTDTPTGTGVVPLGMFHLMAELVSLEGLTAEEAVAAATGSVGRVYGLDAGILEVGRPADLLVLDAPLGSAGDDWAQALAVGDMPALCAGLTGGEVRYTKSRNTPAPKRPVTVLG
jgi:enamidase